MLTGSPVVVITTPTIYKSFIRKYAALSALSPALLRHSHRYKRATIGEPLRFQGATFKFIYTLHTIPCVGFRVEWRCRSMVFTGDHFNSPADIDKLEETGVLSRGRANDLRNLPRQECDVLLHEAGAPPIHTPLDMLLTLPAKVKKRLYVVHTSALPVGSLRPIEEEGDGDKSIWRAGDWTGPIALQPDIRLSGESERCETHDAGWFTKRSAFKRHPN